MCLLHTLSFTFHSLWIFLLHPAGAAEVLAVADVVALLVGPVPLVAVPRAVGLGVAVARLLVPSLQA